MVEENTTNKVIQGKKEKKQLNLTKQHKQYNNAWHSRSVLQLQIPAGSSGIQNLLFLLTA